MSLFPRNTLVLATRNPGKVAEMERHLGPLGVKVTTSAALGLPEVPETGTTFEANAALKAESAAAASGLAVLADDSGLSAEALDGAPGVYTADWAGPERNFRMAMARLGKEVAAAGGNDRAKFISLLMLLWPDGRRIVARGEVHGRLVFPGRGTGGFGYDPVFIPDGDTKTFGEMVPAEKARYSHRKRAIDRLMTELGV
ncbi:MAG: RdgB/HAM1 family non-canonical purine NTP pyrophosphatase [Pseudomonadota bacterium]